MYPLLLLIVLGFRLNHPLFGVCFVIETPDSQLCKEVVRGIELHTWQITANTGSMKRGLGNPATPVHGLVL